jgi:small subunit ribosomal protein S15
LHIIPIIWAQRYENGLENIYYTTKYFLQNVVRYKDNGYLCTLKRKILYITKKLRIMYLDAAKKQEIFEKYGKSNSDTGSAEAQIALFSYRISHLTEHMKLNRKDYSTERALTMLVGKRRRLLDYLKAKDIERYRAIIKTLGLRK